MASNTCAKKIEDDIKSSSAAAPRFFSSAFSQRHRGNLGRKFSWGTFWNWGSAPNFHFRFAVIYGAYFALRSAIEVEEKRATLAAVYSIIAGRNNAFFHVRHAPHSCQLTPGNQF